MNEVFRSNVNRIKAITHGTARDSAVLSVHTLATRTLETMLRPRAGDKVLLITDAPADATLSGAVKEGRLRMLARWKAAFDEMSVPVAGILVYPQTTGHGAPLPDQGSLIKSSGRVQEGVQVRNALETGVIHIAMTEFSATAPLKLANDGTRRIVSMPGVTEEMEPAMAADYEGISKRAREIISSLSDSKILRVEFTITNGTERHILDVDVGGRIFHVDDVVCTEPGNLINFPSGEVYIAPYEGIEGDPSKTNGNIPLFLDATSNAFVILSIFGNKIQTGSGIVLPQKMAQELARKPDNGNLAEFAVGLNPNARTAPDTHVLEREKALGFHLAYGISAHLGGTVGPNTADVHQDVVYPIADQRVTIKVNGRSLHQL